MLIFARPGFGTLVFTILGLLALPYVSVEAGNTTCAGNLTDWYTNAVGETACTTYQRLRQICNPQYQVPDFRPNTPGDNCDDQLADCCCNSISWALSMLCMNCQWDIIGGSPNGIDAGAGAYGMYRSPSGTFCNPGTNQSLPADIQTSACNVGIKLDNFLYELFWNTGDWYFVYTMDSAVEQQAQYNNNTFTHCNSTTSTTSVASAAQTSSITASTPTATPTPVNSTLSVGSIAGGVVGGVAGLALILGTCVFCWRKRNHRQSLATIHRNAAMTSAAMPSNLVSSLGDSTRSFSDVTRRIRHTDTSASSEVGERPDGAASHPSQDTSDVVRPDPLRGPARHEDLGPVSTLYRSRSGRLPPAYDAGWEQPHRTRARPLPRPAGTDIPTFQKP